MYRSFDIGKTIGFKNRGGSTAGTALSNPRVSVVHRIRRNTCMYEQHQYRIGIRLKWITAIRK